MEADRLEMLAGAVDLVDTPSQSGRGQGIARCPTCRIALWSNYGGRGDVLRFARVGTLDDPDRFPPDVHIYTMSKQPWVTLDPKVPAFHAFYDAADVWSTQALERRRAAVARFQSRQSAPPAGP